VLVAAVMLDPGVFGGAGDVLRGGTATVDGNWVSLAAVAFPALMLLMLLVLRAGA